MVDDCIAHRLIKLQQRLDAENPATLHLKVVSSCCGHSIYPKTAVIKNESNMGKVFFEYYSDKPIPRIRRFYRRDKQGYYYIPEVCNENKKSIS